MNCEPFAIAVIFPNKGQKNMKVKQQGHPKEVFLGMVNTCLSLDFIKEEDILALIKKRKN